MGNGVIQVDDLKEIFSNNKALFEKSLKIFAADYPRVLTDIIQNVDGNDHCRLEQNAHKLKGMLRYLAAHNTVEEAFQLEKMGTDKNITSHANQHITRLQQAYKDILTHGKTLLEKSFNWPFQQQSGSFYGRPLGGGNIQKTW